MDLLSIAKVIINLGNTCFFNAINQILLNLPILQKLFLDNRIKYFINKENTFGHQGKLFDNFKSLYWIKKSEINNTAKNLKELIGIINVTYCGSNQQDANEYLNFLLDHLHEELNMHSIKKYKEEKDDFFNHNTKDEIGDISWSNYLKNNISFIDSIFKFQLNSKFKCKKCNKCRYNFDVNFVIDLPLPLPLPLPLSHCKMVTVEIFLYRLPFIYKVYFDKINENFQDYLEKDENKNKSITQILWNYYSNVLTSEEKQQHVIELHFSFDFERNKKILDIIKILRGIIILNLEPENITENYINENLTEIKFEQPIKPDFVIELDNGDLIIACNNDDKIYNYELLVYRFKDQQYFLLQKIKEGGLGLTAKYYITGHCSYTRQYHKLDYKIRELDRKSDALPI